MTINLLRLALFIALACTVLPVFAKEPIPTFYEEPGLSPNREYINQHVSEKIDPFTGKLQIHSVDLHIPGNGGLDITIQRSYTSVDEFLHLIVPSPIGVGWTMHFGRLIRRQPTAICDADPNPAHAPVVELPDGSRQLLYLAAIDVVQAMGLPTNRVHWLTTNRWRAECAPGGSGMFVFSPEGVRYEMTTPGIPLGSSPFPQDSWYTTNMVDRNGNRLGISYTNLGGLYTTVREVRGYDNDGTPTGQADGRVVTFAYVNNALASITHGTRTWRYAHVYSTDLLSPTSFPFLARVERPDQRAWGYDYHLTRTSTAGTYAMRQMTYPTGGSYSYSYGRVQFNSHVLGPPSTVVSRKTGSDGHIWTFAYDPADRVCQFANGGCTFVDGSYDRTTVMAPDATYEYAHIGANSVQGGMIWAIGLMLWKTIDHGYEIEQPRFAAQRIADVANTRPGIVGGDAKVYAPIQIRHARNRNGAVYATDFFDHDPYGNPTRVVETGPDGLGGTHTRTTIQTYFTNPEKWLIRLPETQTTTRMPGGSEGTTTRVVRVYELSTGNMRSESRDGVTTSWTHTLQGDIASKTDARGKTIHYLNYHRGVPQREEQPENVVVTRQVSPDGNVLAETDGELKTVRYDYDGLNRIITIDHPLGNDVIVTWGTNTRTVTRGSYVEETRYDGYGRVDRVTHRDTARGEAITQTYAYDAYGRQTFASYPNDTKGTRTGYDVLGRPTRVEHATTLAGTPTAFMTHTYLGHVVRQINERDFAYHYTYRGYGNPDAQELMALAAPEPAANVTITRNVRGQPVTVAQGLSGDTRTRQYVYDAHYFLERQTDPEVGDTFYGRDAVGNMISRRVGTSQTTIFDYDDRNRLTAIRYPASRSTGMAAPPPNVTRTYYRDDKPKTIDNTPSALRSYIYDDNKNLTSETLELAGQKFTMQYGYDANDALASLTYGSGARIDYAPDAFGRPTRATPYLTAIEHYPHGAVKKLVYTNGTVHEVTLHPRLWPETIAATSPVTLLSRLGYQYDEIGNVRVITDSVVAGNNWSLDYDPIDRVVTASGGGVAALHNISYDGRGNLKRKAIGFSVYDYTYHPTSERLTRVQGTRTNIAFTPPITTTFDYILSYDLYGNIVDREGIAFQYNDAGHLACARCFTSSEHRYTYDGAGIRVSDRQGQNTTFYMYGNAGTLLWEVGPNGEVKEYIYIAGQQVAVRRLRP